jgi:hypothetical protein
VETGDSAEKLKALKTRLETERVVAFFSSPSDLRAKVLQSLVALREKRRDEASEVTGLSSGFWIGRRVPPHFRGGEDEITDHIDKIETWYQLEENVWNAKSAVLTAALFSLKNENLSPEQKEMVEGFHTVLVHRIFRFTVRTITF